MKRVLIVDDDQFICELIRRIAEQSNYAVMIARSGNIASAFLANELIFRAVITDVQMKDGDGLDVLRAIQRMSSEDRPQTLIHSSSPDYCTANGDTISLADYVHTEFGTFAEFHLKDPRQTTKNIKEFLAKL